MHNTNKSSIGVHKKKTEIRGTDVNSLTEWDIRKRFIKGSAKPVTHLHRPLVKIIASKLIKATIPGGI